MLFSSSVNTLLRKVEVFDEHVGENKLYGLMSSTQSPKVIAVLKARDLILWALENADSTTLEYLISLQETICNLNLGRLLEEIKKRERSKGA